VWKHQEHETLLRRGDLEEVAQRFVLGCANGRDGAPFGRRQRNFQGVRERARRVLTLPIVEVGVERWVDDDVGRAVVEIRTEECVLLSGHLTQLPHEELMLKGPAPERVVLDGSVAQLDVGKGLRAPHARGRAQVTVEPDLAARLAGEEGEQRQAVCESL